MKAEYVQFTSETIPDAGILLAGQHTRNRKNLPLLPSRFEDPLVATKAVESVFSRKTAFGFAAVRGGKLAAYLIGETSPQMWGRCGYIYLPGCGLAEGESPELLQDLYAFVGDEWNQAGCFNHYIYLCAADEAVIDAWALLGFGHERADAILNLRTIEIPELKLTCDFEISRSGVDDSPRLVELSNVIVRHQSRAPRWHPSLPEHLDDLAEGWAEIAGDPEWTIWLATRGNETFGCAGFCAKPEADTDLLVPQKSYYLSIAATKDSARGRGIAAALTWHGMKHGRANGFEFCMTDWQTANLLAARTWPRFGFKTVAYRLARTINPMIAWAKQ